MMRRDWFEDSGDAYVLKKKLLDKEIESMKLECNDMFGVLSLKVIYKRGAIELLSVNVPNDADMETISAEQDRDANCIEIKVRKK